MIVFFWKIYTLLSNYLYVAYYMSLFYGRKTKFMDENSESNELVMYNFIFYK